MKVNFESSSDHRNDERKREFSDARVLSGQRSATNDYYEHSVDYDSYAEVDGDGRTGRGSRPRGHGDRTERLINRGRTSAFRPGLSLKWKIVAAGVSVAAVVTVLALTVFGGGASWPASVATVQSEIAKACQNPDVASEPGQVNFACAKSTRQVLWVLSLMTSDDDPNFRDPSTGRMGLEPIGASQGGEVAWSLNLHQPYNPLNPVDSLEVAARAINNIVGGATLIGSNGAQQVEAGLESKPSDCARYTGSAAIVSRRGYPSLCALPVTSAAGQAALVTDIYQEWVVGASSITAQDAGVLFENANNPGNSQVQAILKSLPDSGL